MKKLIFAIIVVAAAGVAYSKWPEIREKVSPSYQAITRTRVENVLRGMQGTSDSKLGTPDQFALSQWAQGKIMVDRDNMESYSNQWDQFRIKHGLYRKINKYEILEVREVESADRKTAFAQIRIDGQRCKWRVVKDLPIAWVE